MGSCRRGRQYSTYPDHGEPCGCGDLVLLIEVEHKGAAVERLDGGAVHRALEGSRVTELAGAVLGQLQRGKSDGSSTLGQCALLVLYMQQLLKQLEAQAAGQHAIYAWRQAQHFRLAKAGCQDQLVVLCCTTTHPWVGLVLLPPCAVTVRVRRVAQTALNLGGCQALKGGQLGTVVGVKLDKLHQTYASSAPFSALLSLQSA